MGFGSYFRDLRMEKRVTQKQIADVIKKKPMLVLYPVSNNTLQY